MSEPVIAPVPEEPVEVPAAEKPSLPPLARPSYKPRTKRLTLTPPTFPHSHKEAWKEHQRTIRRQIRERGKMIRQHVALEGEFPVLGKLIVKRKLSHAEIARQIKRDPSYISHLCAGRRVPSLGTSKKIAGILGVTLDEFQEVLERTRVRVFAQTGEEKDRKEIVLRGRTGASKRGKKKGARR